MFFKQFKWFYQRLHVSAWMPCITLIAYTVFGGFIFRLIERNPDIQRRMDYRNRTNFALEQIVERMLEVKCHDALSRSDIQLQEKHVKEAIFWFLDHLNLTSVIEENTDDTPWTWIGAMFYAGQLYTTIGYGVPTTKTLGGRIATIFYILIGIPIFLIILKDMGRVLSRTLRKIYKRTLSSKRKIANSTSLNKIPFGMNSFKNSSKGENKCFGDIESSMKLNDGQSLYETQLKSKKLCTPRESSFPISIALTILIFWILFSASLFCIWEREWGFVTSVYFFFVSISTVGLGDIVFSNPEMMIYNFGLILVGLALLSMCFNLIQNALERMLDRLLDEYIEEIEKMAEIAHNDEDTKEAMPLELKMAGGLLSLPMKKVTSDSGFFFNAKGWVAERIANNLIESRLANAHDSDSEDEQEEEEKEKNQNESIAGDTYEQRKKSSLTSHHGPLKNYNRRLFNTIRTLEKIRPKNENFKSVIFSKFVQSDKLNNLMEDEESNSQKYVTSSCQTDPVYEPRKPSMYNRRCRQKRIDSNSSYSTIHTNSALFPDDDSIMSTAFCDLKFDYSSDTGCASLYKNSSHSMFKLDDDYLLATPQRIQKIYDSKLSELPEDLQKKIIVMLKTTDEERELILKPRRLASLSAIDQHRIRKQSTTEVRNARNMCGLLPQDFHSPE